ncbi:MAG TPA: DDE-type integrase/transposase/recombinase, partial [Myxococcota bacterium]|nr:DDE-type integrase/transposase/recombinase [Myxococcota bacterium]
TLERWYYRFKNHGLAGLAPNRRRDLGRARALSGAQKELILAIRREHPNASVPLILSTLERDGRLAHGAVSPTTLRRLFRQQGLDRRSQAASNGDGRVRLRWQAERPGVLWHADVCHGPALKLGGVSVPIRIHALLDDASRYIVAITAFGSERESDMLALLVQALRSHGAPEVLYLDNGSTYRGDTLATACGRLGVSLLHARPYDPQARGKMERFWRTLRQGCLSHLGEVASLHDVNVKVQAFVRQHYHVAPHASLMGRSPAAVWSSREAAPNTLTESKMRDALTVRRNRRIQQDSTVAVGGAVWELAQGFLAGRKVTVARSLLDPQAPPWVEHEDKRLPLHRVNPVANGRRRRTARATASTTSIDVPFDPVGVLLGAPAPAVATTAGGEP